MPEILDSSQENYEHLWVNGEKYVFSDEVVSAGNNLFKHFVQFREIELETCHDMVAGFEAAWV